ncbi:MAG: hypothetical protein WCJ64_21955 [Rhodospirillaceae bacterium]
MDTNSFAEARRDAADLIRVNTGHEVTDMLTIICKSSLERYGRLTFESAQDSERCHEMLDEYLPAASEVDVPDTAARKAERIRLALIAGKLTEAQAFKMLALVAATIVVDSKAAMMKEMFYVHDVILGVTDDDPERVYDLSNEEHVVELANAHHYTMYGE